MRTRIDRWEFRCDYCERTIDPSRAITGTGRGDCAILETEYGYLYADEDNCWCDVECLCAWIEIQLAKLKEAA